MEQPESVLASTVIAHPYRTKTKYMRIDGSVKTNTRTCHHGAARECIGHDCSVHARRTKTKYMRIDGSVKTNTRQALVNDFQNNRDLRAAVLSIQAAGTGLTLTVRSAHAAPACQSALSDNEPGCSADSPKSSVWEGIRDTHMCLSMTACLPFWGAYILMLRSAH